jgi:hypothetical protein
MTVPGSVSSIRADLQQRFSRVVSFFRTISSFSLSNGHVLVAFRYWSRQIRPVSVSESDGYEFVVDKDLVIVLLKDLVPTLRLDRRLVDAYVK